MYYRQLRGFTRPNLIANVDTVQSDLQKMKILNLSNPVHGWIDITFGEEPEIYTLTASDVPNDCLRDLAAATVRLKKGSIRESVEFSIEPGFVKCELYRESDSLRVVFNHPEHTGPVFDATFPFTAFSNRLKFELLRIESSYSTHGGWTQSFPHREVGDLG